MDIKDNVKNLLTGLGYSLSVIDEFLLDFTISKVTEDIKNYLGIGEIPEGLTYVLVYRVAGEFLMQVKNSGLLTSDNLDLNNKIVTSISMGDTSTSFSDKNSAETRINSLIEYLSTTGQDTIDSYRQIKW